MTLYWWMHWFWVTTQIVASLTSPSSEKTASSSFSLFTASSTESELARIQQNFRIAKAIGMKTPGPSSQVIITNSSSSLQLNNLAITGSFTSTKARTTINPAENKTAFEFVANKSLQIGIIPNKKESKITWIQTFNKSPKSKYEDKTSSAIPSGVIIEDLMTVIPLRESGRDPRIKSLESNPIIIRKNQQHPSSGEPALGQQMIDPNEVDTVASILDTGFGDSTRLGRARGTFTSKFQQKQVLGQELHSESKEEMIKETVETNANVTEIATITGSCLAIIILLSTIGSLGFIMYRRKYLNSPQTLNSDKCSNPDSSAYIDDSTIRDNSEEMYSLDNDSFLNSLEAMTIQNYWTDSVKHTKL